MANIREQRETAAESEERNVRLTNEEAQMTDEEMREVMRKKIGEFEENFLPDTPKIPGYHTFWASTTSTINTVQKYQRLGYTPIYLSDIPLAEREKYRSIEGQTKAEYGGMVMSNEMLAMKLPEPMYQELMKYNHHDLPMRHDAKIVNMQREISDLTGGNTFVDKDQQGLGGIKEGKGPPVFR